MVSDTPPKVDPISSLRRIALALGGLSVLFLLLIHRFLSQFWGGWVANRWFVLTLGVMLFLILSFWRNLSNNYRVGEQRILPSLGTGNTLTFLRGVFIAAAAGFIAVPPPRDLLEWMPAIFYTLASLGDFMDGYLARRQDQSTRLGEILDMYVDGIGVLVATVLLLLYGKVPVWYLLVGLARYLFLGGIWLRRRMGKPVYDLPANDVRRTLAAVQMVFIFILLWPIFGPPATAVAAAAFAVPFLVSFLRDWLVISGVLTPHSKLPVRIKEWLFGWLPVLLRVAIFILIIASALDRFLDFPTQIERLTRLGYPMLGILHIPMLLLELVLSVMILMGFSVRTAALAGLILVGIQANFLSLTYLHFTLIILYSAIFHLGSGLFSLWQPEEGLIGLRAGHATSDSAQPRANVPLNSNSSLSETA